ncbi:PREDICTED: protein PTCD3 homolog, mitochondrial [Trachymyrmex septentrionalis]|uniref:protein PTCD3 homolog, mitochondrial n=1 Tax=Trachymyrmex septentrionalis TaxID=34720 RepID=UPI00084F45D5|nr:PREDICTED: protein PTCD3 homolog, mitochondrial [Trachymyrmex septentrionalis]
MNSLSRIIRGKLYQELIVRLQSTTITSASSSDIQIPNRIERGPTDILKALESTISRDYTAPHYKFHDDPFLIPQSSMQNRSYALAKESGRKTAMWVREEHRDLFQHKVADPEIKAFVPLPIYTEESKVTEETLLYEISNGNVANCITIYDLLKGEMTIPTKQALLELLCFYNNNERTDEWLETHWYKLKQKSKWLSYSQIDVLFEFLKEQEPKIAAAAYTAMICGLAKYLRADKAWHFYDESQGKNIPLSVNGYNAMISLVPMLKQEDLKSKSLTYIYRAMTTNGITPNIHTFNAALNVATTLKTNQSALDFTRETLADITKFKLKPSLTTYYYLLKILSRFGDASYNNFIKILTSLKNETITVQNENDLNFFIVAMEMASQQFCDRQAGEMVNELLLTGENYKFINNNKREYFYYRMYLELILATEEFETFFKLYSKLVPHVIIPEPAVMNAILEALKLHPVQTATQYIPKLWSHMIMFSYLNREELLENILHLMSVHCKPVSDSPLNAQFAEMALTIWDHIQAQNSKRLQHVFVSNTIIGNIILLLLRANNFTKTTEIISLLVRSPHLIKNGQTITTEHINQIFELCLAQAYVPAIFTLLEYVTFHSLEGAGEMAGKLYKTVSLTLNQENILASLVGNDVLQLQISDKT